ncbi:MAG: RNA polymerase sigma factor [Paludibacter sp.]|nr:RNA polymerase sigma factor [Paludibacter sp.]
MSEQKLIQAILNGDSSKFELLVLKYQTMVFHTAMGFVHNREDAEDLTQDIFIHAFESLSSFKGNSEFSTWLYRISVNTSINQLKKRKRSQIFHFAEDLLQSIFNKESNDPDPEQYLIDIERNVAIRNAIDSLPEKQRTAFVLSKYDDLSQKEIAAIMHCSEGSVEQLLQRTKTSLQRKLSIKVGNK